MDNNSRILFSIIIPVYKVEHYLDQCISSIISQKYKNYEIILVDDGSPDKCPEICDKWAEKEEAIRVIHKQNGGSSSARNAGVRCAQGEYIIFVDSDDYWNDNSALSLFAETIQRVENVDVVVFNNIDFSCATGKNVICNRKYNIKFMESAEKDDVLQYLFNNHLFPGAAWLTVTRREFLINNKIEFIEGIKAEDIDWLLNVFLQAKRYSALNESFYVYRKYRGGSITNTADIKSIDDILYIIDIWINRLKDNTFSKIRKNVYSFLCIHYMCAILILDDIKKEDKNLCKNKLKKYRYICWHSNSLCIRLSTLLPLILLSRLLKIYRRILNRTA